MMSHSKTPRSVVPFNVPRIGPDGTWVAVSALVVFGSCGAHPLPAAEALVTGTHVGRHEHRLFWDGREVGFEAATVRLQDGWRRWEGELVQREPIRTDLSWTVLTDPASREPGAFEVELELAGERVETQAWRDGDVFRVERRAFGRTEASSVGYGAGTAVDVGSPLSGWWAWRLLDALDPGEKTDVRAIVLRAPALRPSVEVVRFERTDDGAVLDGPGDETTRFQLADDGWPDETITDRPTWPRSLVRQRIESEESGP